MKKLLTPGRIIFALGIIALGVLQFFVRDFVVGRPPAILWPLWAATSPGKFAWACFSGACFIAAGLAVLINKKAGPASIIIGILIFLFSFLLRHLPAMTDWGNTYKSLALGGGAFIVAASFTKTNNGPSRHAYTYHSLVLTGIIFLSVFLVFCGIAHFKFNEFVKLFIPAYIPARPFWASFTGIALIAGGIGLLFTITRKWAALLSGVMILLWFILLHIPRTVTASHDYTEWMGVFESLSLSGIFFVLAAMSAEKKYGYYQTPPANN